MSREYPRTARLPPRWIIRSAWVVHRALYRFSGGRLGLTSPRPGKYGMLRLKTIGRRSGKEHSVILAYYADGPNLVTLAMNGWASGEPAWWLNVQAHPDAIVDVTGGSMAVRGRAATGAERDRLWSRWRDYSSSRDDLDAYAARRSSPTAVVILERRA
jgi:deazaflavin-dependent oxidoreductase (nitroreductase family)